MPILQSMFTVSDLQVYYLIVWGPFSICLFINLSIADYTATGLSYLSVAGDEDASFLGLFDFILQILNFNKNYKLKL